MHWRSFACQSLFQCILQSHIRFPTPSDRDPHGTGQPMTFPSLALIFSKRSYPPVDLFSLLPLLLPRPFCFWTLSVILVFFSLRALSTAVSPTDTSVSVSVSVPNTPVVFLSVCFSWSFTFLSKSASSSSRVPILYTVSAYVSVPTPPVVLLSVCFSWSYTFPSKSGSLSSKVPILYLQSPHPVLHSPL